MVTYSSSRLRVFPCSVFWSLENASLTDSSRLSVNVLPIDRKLCGPSLLPTPTPCQPSLWSAVDCTFQVGLLTSGCPEQRVWKAHMLFLLTFSCSLGLGCPHSSRLRVVLVSMRETVLCLAFFLCAHIVICLDSVREGGFQTFFSLVTFRLSGGILASGS